jgi:hypothetical protein
MSPCPHVGTMSAPKIVISAGYVEIWREKIKEQ